MFKKLFCMLIVIAMLFTFCSCKNKETSSSDISFTSGNESTVSDNQSNTSDEASGDESTSNPTSEVTSAAGTVGSTLESSVPKKLQGTSITVYSWNAAKDVSGATTVIKNFQKDTKIKVNWITGSYDNYKTEIAALVAANNSPDVIRLRGVEPGILSLMSPLDVSGYDFKEDIWDSFIKDTYTFNGNVYAVNRKNTLLQQPLVMFYNKSLVTKYDLDDPYAIWKKNKSNWNWDTFLEICSVYKDAAGADSKPWMVNAFKDYAMTTGANHLTRNGSTFVSNMSDNKLVTGYQKMAELRQKGMISFGWDMNGFNTDKYLFFGPAIISARRTHFDLTDLKSKGTLGVVPYPSVKGQSVYYQNIWEAEAYGIPKGSKNPEAVPYFLKYYLDGDKYDANTFFNDKKTLDVYKYCMNETTLVPEYDRCILHLDFGGAKYLEYLSKLETATADQIPTIINTYSGIIKNATDQANAELAKLGR